MNLMLSILSNMYLLPCRRSYCVDWLDSPKEVEYKMQTSRRGRYAVDKQDAVQPDTGVV